MPDPVSLRNVMANSFINESHLSSKANVNESAGSVIAEHMIKKQEEKKEQVQKTEETEDKLIKDEHSEENKHQQNLSSSSKEPDENQEQDSENTDNEHFIDFVI